MSVNTHILTAMLLACGLAGCGNQADKQAAATQAASEVAGTASAPINTASAPAASTPTEATASPASAATQNGPVTAFTAYGVGSTAWRATVDGHAAETGNKLTLECEKIDTVEADATRSAYAKGVEFSANANGNAINLNIRTQDCKDDQGNTTPFTATLDYGKTTLKGCAVAGVVAREGV